MRETWRRKWRVDADLGVEEASGARVRSGFQVVVRIARNETCEVVANGRARERQDRVTLYASRCARLHDAWRGAATPWPRLCGS